MLTFNEFLTEDKTGKLTHLTHLEDVLLDDGLSGVSFILDVLNEFGTMLRDGGVSRALNVTTKWDGAPSVVFGVDPMDGEFFVATKGAFSNTPKLMKTPTEITEAYGTKGVAPKLQACLTYLRGLSPNTILQGDLLFTDDVKTQTIDGTVCYTFQPNTIVYAVPVQSGLGQSIGAANIGLVVHTMYAGNGPIQSRRAAPISPTVFASLRRPSSVFLIDSTFDDLSGTVTFTTSENTDFDLAVAKIEQWSTNIGAKVCGVMSSEPIHMYAHQFINSQVRSGTYRTPKDMVQGFLDFLDTIKDREMSARSSAAGQSRVQQIFITARQQLLENLGSLQKWFSLYTAIVSAKLLIVRKLASASRFGTFVPTPNGLQVTTPEGFVAVAHSGKMVKLVDRLEFSRNNFLNPKVWA